MLNFRYLLGKFCEMNFGTRLSSWWNRRILDHGRNDTAIDSRTGPAPLSGDNSSGTRLAIQHPMDGLARSGPDLRYQPENMDGYNRNGGARHSMGRSEEHTSEPPVTSGYLVC